MSFRSVSIVDLLNQPKVSVLPVLQTPFYAEQLVWLDLTLLCTASDQPRALGHKGDQPYSGEDLWPAEALAREKWRHRKTECFTMFPFTEEIS
jgi:hypothetical protein